MQTRTIDINAAIKTGWQIVTKNPAFFVGITIFLLLANLGESLLENATNNDLDQPTALTFVLMIIFFVFNILISLGFIKVCLDFLNNKKSQFSDLFSCLNLVGKSFLANMLSGLIVVAPILIFFIPLGISFVMKDNTALSTIRVALGGLGVVGIIISIYFSLRFMFTQYFIVDKNSGVIESLKLSSEATKGVKWQLILLGLVMLGIMLLGVLAFFVGILIALPVTMVANAAVYKQLTGQSAAPSASPAPSTPPAAPVA